MLKRPSQQGKIESAVKQNNSSQLNALRLTDLPREVLLTINDYLPFVKDTTHSAFVNKYLYAVFQPEIEKKGAKVAAVCAIIPIKRNVEKLKKMLFGCPALLLRSMKVSNRHGQVIKGTIYQIALHEADNELIDDVIRPAFEKLYNGLEMMEAQRKVQLPDGWMEAEERACASTLAAIDNVFNAFKNASNPNDVTEFPRYPYMITINNQNAKEALEACRKAIDTLYQPTDKEITSGRDPSIRLLERVVDRYAENFDAFGGREAPRNNTLIRAVFGYCQRFAPVNFMQAFALGPEYIVEEEKKLTRSFEYYHMPGNFIIPLDLDPQSRLGYEHFAADSLGYASFSTVGGSSDYKAFCQLKTAAALQPCTMQSQKSNCTII